MLTPPRSTRIKDQFQQFNEKCVCEICTCGKHHCPPKNIKFVGETTSHRDFKAYQIKPQRYQPESHQVHQRHYDPEMMKTSYEKDFQPYQVQPHLNPVKYEYTQKKTFFYDETEYKKSYLPFQVAVERPATCTPIDYRNKAKFDGTTTYNVEFSPKHVDKVSYTPVRYERKNIPFQGETVYNSEYKPHKIQITKPTVCYHDVYQGRKNKFMGESRYQEEYKPFEVEKKCTCPVTVMPSMPRTCSPGKTHLNYSAEKHRWE